MNNSIVLIAVFAGSTCLSAGVRYSTLLGGSSTQATSIVSDRDGNMYLTGQTSSTDFPVTPGSHQSAPSGFFNTGFVVKISAGGTLIYSTYLGSGSTLPQGIAGVVRSRDEGVTLEPLPSLPRNPAVDGLVFGPNQWWAISAVAPDCFVTRYNGDDGTIQFSTFFGGAGAEVPSGIGLDGDGNIYIAGTTNSLDLNGARNTPPGSVDSFLAKFIKDGSRLLASRYFGGRLQD